MQDAILSMEMFKVFENLMQKHGLHVDQAGALGDEINLALLGLSPRSEFQKKLASRMPLPESKITEIVKDVDEQIFKKIRSVMQQIPAPTESLVKETPLSTPAASQQKPPLRDVLQKTPKLDIPVEVPVEPVQETSAEPPASLKVATQENQAMSEPTATQTPLYLEKGQSPREEVQPQETPPTAREAPDEHLDRLALLKEIETISTPRQGTAEKTEPSDGAAAKDNASETPINLPTGGIAEAKLEKMFQIPHEEKVLPATPKEEESKPAAEKTRPYSVDPYREPTV